MPSIPLCLNLRDAFPLSCKEQIRVLRDLGFSGFFSHWREDMDIAALRRCAEREDMLYQSIHAPFRGTELLWTDAPEGDAILAMLLRCLQDCARNGIPVMVMHASLGFDKAPAVPESPARFAPLFQAAEKYGVRLAVENVDHPRRFHAMMRYFQHSPALGFCWDTGHERCYSGGEDHLAHYGQQLVATHLNDNLGMRAPAGQLDTRDDLHLLPYDGTADWDALMARLARCGYRGPLTFELKHTGRPSQHECARYAAMSPETYLSAAAQRARQVADAFLRHCGA